MAEEEPTEDDKVREALSNGMSPENLANHRATFPVGPIQYVRAVPFKPADIKPGHWIDKDGNMCGPTGCIGHATILMAELPTKDYFFSHESGAYDCLCSICDSQFIGLKRAIVCRECNGLRTDRNPPTPEERKNIEQIMADFQAKWDEFGRKLKAAQDARIARHDKKYSTNRPGPWERKRQEEKRQ